MRFFRLRDVGAGVGAGAACFVLVGCSFTWSQFSAHGWTQTPGLLLPSLPRFPRPRPRRGPRQAHFALRLPRACNAVVVQLSSAGADFGEDDLAALRKKREAILAKKKAWARKAADDASSAAAAAAGEGKGEGGESNETGKAAAPPPPPPSGSPATPARASVAAPPPSPSRPRPARKAPSPAPPTRGRTSPSPSPAPQAKGLDYAADYPDENDLHIPNRIGFGTQSWGDESRGFVSQGRLTKKMVKRGRFVPGDLQVAYNTLLECGIQFIDTSERYGDRMRSKQLSSEHILGLCAEENTGNESPIVASKFELGVGLPRMGSRAVIRAVKRSCDRLETSCIDLYQVQANPWLYVGGGRALADGLAYAVDRGLCSYVGVCNMSARGMKSMQRKLDRRGVQLASNQFEFSLTNRDALLDGRIQACKDLGVVPIAHTPLDGGLATGKFTALNPTGGVVGVKARYDFQTLDPLSPVHETQDKVAQLVRTRLLKEFNDEKEMRLRNYKRKPMEGDFNRVVTSTQVAINYVVAKGAVPIPGINNLKEAEELLGCLGWSLTDHEVAMLDDAADTARRNRSLSTTPKKRNPFFSSRKNPRLLDF